jgi:pimeloyl-ACP methyl ester carboxylesterase
MRFLYIHGFASGPRSRKAQTFRKALAARDIDLEVPELDEGDFEHLTISGQLAVIADTLRGEPARLVGSSMGGYLAALYAAAHPEVSRLVLLAPAFSFAPRWREKLGRELAQSAPPEYLEVFHYASNAMRRVHYRLIDDALRYPATPDFVQPARIFHGVHDDVVPVDYSRQFSLLHPNAELTELDSDHELLDVLDRIAGDAVPFLTEGLTA